MRPADGVGAKPDIFVYDAFLSYSHASDTWLAIAIERVLSSLARPWYRRRALRIFRDDSQLGAGPPLYSSLERALGASRYFVLLASPESAASRWVAEEVSWWVTNRSKSTFIIVLTAGEIVWPPMGEDFDWGQTDALPGILTGYFDDEPLWVDLRRFGTVVTRDAVGDPRFREAIAKIAAPLRGRSIEDLVGEDGRQHRRAIRLAAAAMISILVLFVIASVSAATALEQRDVAIHQRDAAQQETRTAASHALAASASGSLITQRLDLSSLLAVQALRLRDDAPAQSAVFDAATASPNLVRFRTQPSPVTAVCGAPNASPVVTGGADGSVRMWTLAGASATVLAGTGHAAVTACDVSVDGRLLAVGDARGGVEVFHLASPGTPYSRAMLPDRIASVAVSERTGTVAAADDRGRIAVLTGPRDRPRRTTLDPAGGSGSRVSVEADGWHLVANSGLSFGRWVLPGLTEPQVTQSDVEPGDEHFRGFSSDGAYFAVMVGARIDVYRTAKLAAGDSAPVTSFTNGPPGGNSVAVAADGRRVAVGSPNNITIIQQLDNARQSSATLTLSGFVRGKNLVAFTGDSTSLVSAGGNTVAVWNLDQASRIGGALPVRLQPGSRAAEKPPAIAQPETDHLLWADSSPDSRQILSCRDIRTNRSIVQPADLVEGESMSFDRTGSYLLISGLTGPQVWKSSRHECPRPFRSIFPSTASDWRALGFVDDSMVALINDNGQIVEVSAAGGVPREVAHIDQEVSRAILMANRRTVAIETMDGKITWVDLRTANVSTTILPTDFADEGSYISDMAAQPGGTMLAIAAGGGEVLLLDMDSHQIVHRVAGSATSIGFNGDGRYLLGINFDRTASVWNATTGVQIGVIAVDPAGNLIDQTTVEAGFDPSRSAIFGGAGSRVWIFTQGMRPIWLDLSEAGWSKSDCVTAGRELTEQEWRQYAGTTPSRDLACRR
jgi:WD40 repeat protein